MKKRNIFIFLGLLFSGVFLLSESALAQGALENLRTFGGSAGQTYTSPSLIAGRIVKAFLSLLGTIAVVLIIYGGFLWMTAAGNEEKVGTAKKLLTQAVIGLAIILAAYSITTFVVERLQEATGEASYQVMPKQLVVGPTLNQ